MTVVSKAELGRRTGVSRQRVGQWIAEGKVHGDALTTDGAIVLETAVAQLGRSLDPVQSMTNGAGTRLADGAQAPADEDADLRLAFQRERLEEARRRNRQAQAEERLAAGTYLRTDDVRAALGRLVGALAAIYGGMVAAVADELAAKFSLPPRDVKHFAQAAWLRARGEAAAAARRRAEGLPELIEIDDDDAGGPES